MKASLVYIVEEYKYEMQRDNYQMDMLRNIATMFSDKKSVLPPRYFDIICADKNPQSQSKSLDGKEILNELMTAW